MFAYVSCVHMCTYVINVNWEIKGKDKFHSSTHRRACVACIVWYFLLRMAPRTKRSIKWFSPSCSRIFRLSDYRPFNRDAIQSQCYFTSQLWGLPSDTCYVSTRGAAPDFVGVPFCAFEKQNKLIFPSKRKSHCHWSIKLATLLFI